MESFNVLILGGVGFVGRNLVEYLLTECRQQISKIRVVDKVPPQLGSLNEKHKKLFSEVEFVQANLINKASVEKAFDGVQWHFVINLAAETKVGLSDAVYDEGIVKLGFNLAKEAERHRVQRFVEVSSSQMYTSDKKAAKEDEKTDPWSVTAKCKIKLETLLKTVKNLDYVIIRPANTYGVADRAGLTTRMIIASLYRRLGEKLKVLWGNGLKANTVHVSDLCAAIWFLCRRGQSGQVYHVVDHSNTTAGSICELLGDMFKIDYEFLGSFFSSLTQMQLGSVVEDINEKHLLPWAEACTEAGIQNTPLSPIVSEDGLIRRNVYLDGSKLEHLGFTYRRPTLTKAALVEVIEDFIQLGLFPRCLLPS